MDEYQAYKVFYIDLNPFVTWLAFQMKVIFGVLIFYELQGGLMHNMFVMIRHVYRDFFYLFLNASPSNVQLSKRHLVTHKDYQTICL